jgi:hypothetical protein
MTTGPAVVAIGEGLEIRMEIKTQEDSVAATVGQLPCRTTAATQKTGPSTAWRT